MEVQLVRENEDGSADYNVQMSAEEQAQLFRFAFIEMLKRGIEEGKQYQPECIYGTCVESDKANCNRMCKGA